jgi:hypothetical protein
MIPLNEIFRIGKFRKKIRGHLRVGGGEWGDNGLMLTEFLFWLMKRF